MNSEIVAKIQKLLALANKAKNNSEAEATAAMAKAQELLTKYNLDLAQIKDSEVGTVKTDNGGPREKTQVNRSAMYAWQQKFWKALAEMNFCFYWVTTVTEQHPRRKNHMRTVKRHVILGSQANVAVVQMMGEYLTEVMERELPYPNTERLSRSAISWREGCAERLIERLQELSEERKRSGFAAEDGTQVTALAVQDVHEKEYAANYDAAYGAGAYARMKQRHAEWDRKAEERRKAEKEERERMLGSETPEQRKARETREAKEAAKQAAADARFWERYYRKAQREANKRDTIAYARGVKKANNVNLDSQIKGEN